MTDPIDHEHERCRHELAQAQRDLAVATERIATLEFERSRLGGLLQKAPGFIAVVRGATHVFELTNDAYAALIGGRDVIGLAVRDALPELAGQPFEGLLDAVLATGTPFETAAMPITLRPRPGAPTEQRYLTFRYEPIVEEDGRRSGVFVQGIDVTEATLAQQRLRAQFHAIPAPTYVWQRVLRDGVPEDILVDFNGAASTVSRGEIEAHRGSAATTYFADDPAIAAEIAQCFETGATIERELDRRHRSTGTSRRLRVTYTPSPPDLVVVHTEDITARRALETELRQAHKLDAVGRLAAGLAHDFNNILTVIVSYAELHLDQVRSGDPLRTDLEEIHKAALRGAGLIQQLLAFTRQQVMRPRLLDLDHMLRGLEPMARRLLGEDIDLVLRTTSETTSEATAIEADPGQLEQVVMNLLVNARDAMPTGGTLTLATAAVDVDARFVADHPGAVMGPHMMLSVSDTGNGMDEATRQQVFEPFFTTKAPTAGPGLGLATVYGIVHQSGGTILVSSDLGHGTTFRVYLPRATRLARATTPPPIAAVAAAPRGGTETILLIEDEEPVRVLVRTILRRGGYAVLDAPNGGEAFLMAEQHKGPIELLLTDVVLPRLSGQQIARHLMRARADLKVLYMSGYTDDAVIRHGVFEVGVAFIQKPLHAQSLLEKVRAVLDGHSQT